MLGLLVFTSCVDDEGNNNMSDVNEAKIEGIEDSYYKVADMENLEIPVKVTGTLSGDDQNSFDYMWYLCAKDIGGTQHSHTVISNEKDLSYPLTNIRPGTYSIYFRATDKATKLIYEKNCLLKVISRRPSAHLLRATVELRPCRGVPLRRVSLPPSFRAL